MNAHTTDLFSIIDYIKRTTGLNVVPGALSEKEKEGLPFYLQKGNHHEIFIEGKRVILDIRKSFSGYTPGQIAKQKALLEKHFSSPVVFCFSEIESYQRNRLIKQRVAFILPKRQMFIPSLFLDLKEFGNSPTWQKGKLGPVSQFLLLYHLQRRSIENIPLGEITRLIPVSAMSVSRGVGELVGSGICRLEGTKSKVISFLNSKKELWDAALPYLTTPLKKTVYLDTLPVDFRGIITGEEALGHYSNLSGVVFNRYAISNRQYLKMKNQRELPEINLFDGEFVMEIWSYPPEVLSDRGFVDPLSLYLLFRDDEDERIQISLDEIIGNIKW